MPNARITVPERVARGEPFEVRIQIRHAMETGYRTDDMGKSIPRNVIRTLTCRYNGEPVFVAHLSSGIAANPYLRFFVLGARVRRADVRLDRRRRNARIRSRRGHRRLMRRALAVALLALVAGGVRAQERTLPLSALRSGIAFSGTGRAGAAGRRCRESRDALGAARRRAVERAAAPGRQLRVLPPRRARRRCAASPRAILPSTRSQRRRRSTSKRASIAAARSASARRRGRAKSDDLLALTAYVAYQSRGMPLAVSIDGPARASFDRGRALYTQRHGQMNLACTQCHDENWGKRLLAENISQGHGNAFPAYRLEWQSLGSLQRRIRACLLRRSRAKCPRRARASSPTSSSTSAGARKGLPIEAPGVRR